MVSKEQILLSPTIGIINDDIADTIVQHLNRTNEQTDVILYSTYSSVHVFHSKDFKIHDGAIKLKRKYGKFERHPIVRIPKI